MKCRLLACGAALRAPVKRTGQKLFAIGAAVGAAQLSAADARG